MRYFKENERALLIDIGTGTRDIMLYSEENALENNSKIVAPTATKKMARLIKQAKKDLKIAGYTMGGGLLSSALTQHLRKGYKIEIELAASFTVRNNREQLLESGFTIKEKIENPDFFFDEIELDFLFDLLEKFAAEEQKISLIGLSVQDHGDHGLGESSRRKRFEYFVNLLGEQPDIRSLIFDQDNVPDRFSRMRSGVKCIRKTAADSKIIIMDTSVSALVGCWFDPFVQSLKGPILYINFGNGHTMACVTENLEICSFYEHHTGIVQDRIDILSDDLEKLVSGELTFEKVYKEGGHGCKTFRKINFSDLAGIVVTGPKREIARQLNLEKVYEATPGGDMMMTGPLGLLRGFQLTQGLN